MHAQSSTYIYVSLNRAIIGGVYGGLADFDAPAAGVSDNEWAELLQSLFDSSEDIADADAVGRCVRCMCHILHNSASSACKAAELQGPIDRHREIVRAFKQSTKRLDILRDECWQCGVDFHMPKLDVKTRWNTVCAMLHWYASHELPLYGAVQRKALDDGAAAELQVPNAEDRAIANVICKGMPLERASVSCVSM